VVIDSGRVDDFLPAKGRIIRLVGHGNSRHIVAALALVGWYLMMPPESAKVPHSVDSDVPLSHWISVATFATSDDCEKALADLQKTEQDPIELDKTGKLQRLRKRESDPALGRARAINAACVESDDFRLNGKK
jgi:hypothetical protein